MTEISTREKIKIAARDIFEEKGYDGARMQAIADRAGVNKAMIFYYYHSKDALFEAIIKDTFTELMTSVIDLLDEADNDPEKMISSFIDRHARRHCEVLTVGPRRREQANFNRCMVELGYGHWQETPEDTRYLDEPFRGQIELFRRV